MFKLSLLDKISFVLVLLGAINWGIYGIFNVNLVWLLLGNLPVLERVVYICIGASAANLIFLIFKGTVNIK